MLIMDRWIERDERPIISNDEILLDIDVEDIEAFEKESYLNELLFYLTDFT
jgi:hypothetical protein